MACLLRGVIVKQITNTDDIYIVKLGNVFTGPTYKLLLIFTVISDVYRPFIPNKTIFAKYCFTPRELWNLLSKAEPGKFNGSGGHSKHLFTRLNQFLQVSAMANCPNS